jgi:hypothetical protein
MCSRPPGLPNMPFGLSGAVTFSSPPKRTSPARRKLIEVSTGLYPFDRFLLFPVLFVVHPLRYFEITSRRLHLPKQRGRCLTYPTKGNAQARL